MTDAAGRNSAIDRSVCAVTLPAAVPSSRWAVISSPAAPSTPPAAETASRYQQVGLTDSGSLSDRRGSSQSAAESIPRRAMPRAIVNAAIAWSTTPLPASPSARPRTTMRTSPMAALMAEPAKLIALLRAREPRDVVTGPGVTTCVIRSPCGLSASGPRR